MDAERWLIHQASPGARLVVLSGPSGVGKGSVVAEIRQNHPSVWMSISVTTRPPRPGEVEGRDYHFVSDARFDEMIAAGNFLEFASYADYRYATPRTPVEARLREGRSALLEIDLQGARQVRAAMPDALLVFLAPPSWPELARRLRGRGTEDEVTVRKRLELAKAELDAEDEFDVVIVNDRVPDAAAQLVSLLPLAGAAASC